MESRFCVCLAVLLLANTSAGEAPVAAGDGPPRLHNVALTTLGATAKGSGQKFNRHWPAINALRPGTRGGALFGAPLTRGRVDLRLVIPCDVEAIAISQLDYRGTRCPKSVDVYVAGKKVKSVELPHQPGKLFQFPLKAPQAQQLGIVVTSEYPLETLRNGKKGPPWGGWGRIQVLSTTDLPSQMAHVKQYTIAPEPNGIAVTQASLAGEVRVYGQPRQTEGHPCTIWDAEDIRHYKEMLGTSEVLKKQYDALQRAMEERMGKPLGVPQPIQGKDGKWQHLPGKKYGGIHTRLALDIANLGTVYALSGEPRYAEFAKKLLLAYADVYAHYAPGNRPGFTHDVGKCYDQRLGDSIWLIQVARGYDLIFNLPSITEAERQHLEDDLVIAAADFIKANSAHLRAPTNWSAIGTAAVLISGYATDTERLVRDAMYGIRGTPEKPTGGVMLHFGERSIDADGMWAEGAMGYQFMALQALITDAEILWHHGIDMYRHRNGALKRLFDSPLAFAYPNLRTPAIHDSGHGSVVGRDSYLYEFGYRRYRDPKYLTILNRIPMHLAAQYQQWPVSILYDRDPKAPVEAVEWESVNLFGVGYGILRNTTLDGTTSLLMDYGPNRSHGHPDKLNIDLWTFGDRLVPDPGSVWYEQPLYRNWYRPTLSHNTLCVDELDQMACSGVQLVFAPGQTFGIQRAMTQAAYSGITMDRALFMTSKYVADLFGAFAQLPRQMDLCWHIRGEFQSDLAFGPFELPKPRKPGYSELANVARSQTSAPWQATFTVKTGEKARFVAAGAAETQTIIGDGWLGLERPKTIIQRRQINSTLYGNAIDYSDSPDGCVKGVEVSGSLEDGYGLLTVLTAEGRDTCFAAYRAGSHKAGPISTDAQQAFVRTEGDTVVAACLGSGTVLDAGATQLRRSGPGLLSLERTANGAYLLANPSAKSTTAVVKCPPLAAMQGHVLDARGRRTGELAKVQSDKAGIIHIELASGARVEFASDKQLSLYEYRQKVLADRQAAVQTALDKEINACRARTEARIAAAKAKPAPKGTLVVIQAEDLAGEGGGKVIMTGNKTASIGKAFAGWNNVGHWLEYTIELPADGYYNLALCYCAEPAKTKRLLLINGKEQEPFAPLEFTGTGGWANGSDDWRIHTAMNPVSKKPLLLHFREGRNTIRMVNVSGNGTNLDYLAVFSPDLSPDRAALAKDLE